MTNQQRHKLQALIRKHVAAQIALSWSGSEDPEDRPIIEANAKYSKQRLNTYISLMVED